MKKTEINFSPLKFLIHCGAILSIQRIKEASGTVGKKGNTSPLL